MNYSDDNYVLYDSTIVSYIVFSILLFCMCLCIFICKLRNFNKNRLYNTEMNYNDNDNDNILDKNPPSYNSINEN